MIFGNPSYEQILLIKNSIHLPQWKPHLQPLLTVPYPSNDLTRAELFTLAITNKLLDSRRLEVVKQMDAHLFNVWAEFLSTLGINTTEDELKQITAPYDPIIDYLKLYYNRPRPHQMAGILGVPLFPRLDHVPLNSSYPSGHTLLSLYIYDYYTERHPELRTQLMGKVLDIKLSREEGGVHYPSDGLFSFKVYKHIKPLLWTV